MIYNRQSVHNAFFHLGLLLMIVGLPISVFLVSLGGLVLAANWVLEGEFTKKWKRLKQNTPALLLLGLFAIHVLWLINTTNFSYASHDLRIKLPLLLLPIVMGSYTSVQKRFVHFLSVMFILSLLVGVVLSVSNYIFYFNPDTDNIRSIVFFSSPIRFSILVVTGIYLLLYFALVGKLKWIVFSILTLIFIFFLALLQSLTGFALLLVVALMVFTFYAFFSIKSAFRWVIILLVIMVPLLTGSLLLRAFENYRTPNPTEVNSNMPVLYSVKTGESYVHLLESFEVENHNYIYRYIAGNELKDAWKERSNKDLMGVDARGQSLLHTLYRYMTSKGLRKDALGLEKLSDQDIQRVEQGYVSAITYSNPLKRRLRAIFFEMNAYLDGRPSQGNSLSQRLVYWQTGWQVASENLIFGVGTGDVNDKMLAQYSANQSGFDSEHRRRPHNQYLTFLIAFGLFGAIYFVALQIYTVKRALQQRNFMALVFVLMVATSCLTEDTLETQIGVTYYAFFYSLLLVLPIINTKGEQFFFNQIWGNSIDVRPRK